MSGNSIYQALSLQAQEEVRTVMVAAFVGTDAIANIPNKWHRRLAYAAKIAMTALATEQKYPEQFQAEGLPPLGNAVMREIRKGQDADLDEARGDIAARLVTSVELQNFAADVITACDQKRDLSSSGEPAGVHPDTAQIAAQARQDPAYWSELDNQAKGYFENLPETEAKALKSDIASGSEMTASQKRIISELAAMTSDDVDRIYQMSQADLVGIAMATDVLVKSDYDPNLHRDEIGKSTRQLAIAMEDYLNKPTGMSAYKLYNKACEQVDVMAAGYIDVRVRQSLEMAVKAFDQTNRSAPAQTDLGSDNIAYMHAARSQFGR